MNEPMTVLTDALLAVVAFLLGRRLWRKDPRSGAPALLWAASFAALGVAALAGGTWHGIPPELLPSLRRALWVATYASIGLADLLMLAGAARAALARRPALAAVLGLTAAFLAATGVVVARRDFLPIASEFAVTLVLLLAFGIDLARRRESAAAFVLGGVAVTFAGGLVLALRLTLHPQFNSNDLFHLIQTTGLWLFYRGALVLRPHGPASAQG